MFAALRMTRATTIFALLRHSSRERGLPTAKSARFVDIRWLSALSRSSTEEWLPVLTVTLSAGRFTYRAHV